MSKSELGKEILGGFAAVGGAFKIAGQRKNLEDLVKKGYVGFKNPAAVAAFHSDPEHVDWTCKFIDGEYRFYPPEHKMAELMDRLNNYDKVYEDANKAPAKGETKRVEAVQEEATIEKSETIVDTKEVVDTYKNVIADLTKTSFVAISTLQSDPSKCRYRLSTVDKRTGERQVVQEFVMDFEGKFSMEILPSVYNQMMGGFPVGEVEKGAQDQRSILFEDVKSNKIMAFKNLTESQLALVKSMKGFVDKQHFDTKSPTRKADSEAPIVMDTKDVVETYKRVIADPTKTSYVSISTLENDPSKCRYRLSTTDRRTGEKRVIQEFVMDFEGKFSMEIIPSVYNQLMGGLPVNDREYGEENHKSITFQDIEMGKMMAFSNLSESQLAVIQNMKVFVDSKYFPVVEEHRGMHK